jgi:hypothetical protein
MLKVLDEHQRLGGKSPLQLLVKKVAIGCYTVETAARLGHGKAPREMTKLNGAVTRLLFSGSFLPDYELNAIHGLLHPSPGIVA